MSATTIQAVSVPVINITSFYKGERWYGHRFIIPGHVNGAEMQTQGDNSKEAHKRLVEYLDRVLGKDKYVMNITQGEHVAKEFTGK